MQTDEPRSRPSRIPPP